MRVLDGCTDGPMAKIIDCQKMGLELLNMRTCSIKLSNTEGGSHILKLYQICCD